MIDHFYSKPELLRRWRCGPLGPHVDQFAGLLIQQGFSRWTGRRKFRLFGHLGQWLEAKSIPLEHCDEHQVSAFRAYHRKHHHVQDGDETTLAMLLHFLRQAGVVPAAIDRLPHDPIELLIQDYTRFLLQERGLSSATLSNYVPVVRRLLSEEFRPGGTLQPRDVNRFLLHQIPHVSRERAHVLTAALRGFLRYLYECGQLDKDLSGCVPIVARGRDANLPRFLEPKQVEALLRRRDPDSPCSRRDHAALLLLARLGLRAGEIVQLSLDDINWEAGEVLIRGKSTHEDRLPLPPDVGRALADYLKRERPLCSSRRVFLRALAPYRGLANPSAVSWIVRRALTRAGIRSEHKGAHLLRHSLATGMLRGGASLAEIGQILRHQRPRTTELYAKVDVAALRALAQPWPGGVR